MKTNIKFLLILISGIFLSLSFYGPGFLAWFCLIPYLLVIYHSNFKQIFYFSSVFGLIYFAGVTYWFTEYSYALWIPIIVYLSLFMMFFGIVSYFIYKKIRWPILRVFLISSTWLVVEYFRNRTFLAFPWGMLAYSQHNYLIIMQIAKIAGAFGVSLILILFNSILAETIIYFNRTSKVNFKYILSIFCLTILVIAYGFTNITFYNKDFISNNCKNINIAMVQPNISFDDKFTKDSGVIIPEPYDTKSFFKKNTELIVFPESVIWGTLDHNETFKEWASKTLKNENLYLIMGQILWDDKNNYYNSVVLYSPNLEAIGRYDKIHPLPCAEYMPYPNILGFLSFLNVAKLNITPAKEFSIINYPNKGDLGINICFESTLPIISRTFRQKGADAIFVFTDDAGFRDSVASWHHVIFSRVRAIENGCFVVHSSNMGISAVINPIGEIISKTELGKKEVMYETIYLNSKQSFYSKFGDIILYIYFGFSFLFLCFYIFITNYNKTKKADKI